MMCAAAAARRILQWVGSISGRLSACWVVDRWRCRCVGQSQSVALRRCSWHGGRLPASVLSTAVQRAASAWARLSGDARRWLCVTPASPPPRLGSSRSHGQRPVLTPSCCGRVALRCTVPSSPCTVAAVRRRPTSVVCRHRSTVQSSAWLRRYR